MFYQWKQKHRDLEKQMGRIEILNEAGNLEVIYFQIPSSIRSFWEKPIISTYKNYIVETVSRDNPEEKVKDFFEKSEYLIFALNHQDRIAEIKRIWCLGWVLYQFISSRLLLIRSADVLSVALNVFFILSQKTDS